MEDDRVIEIDFGYFVIDPNAPEFMDLVDFEVCNNPGYKSSLRNNIASGEIGE